MAIALAMELYAQTLLCKKIGETNFDFFLINVINGNCFEFDKNCNFCQQKCFLSYQKVIFLYFFITEAHSSQKLI